MKKEYICIMCPNGCSVEVTYEPASAPGEAPEIISTYGNLCPRGAGYARQELIDPRRTIATSILVEGGELPLASVRLTAPIPKDRLLDAVAEIRKIKVTAPVKAGTVVIRDLLGLKSDVIVTKTVDVSRGRIR